MSKGRSRSLLLCIHQSMPPLPAMLYFPLAVTKEPKKDHLYSLYDIYSL